MRKKHHRHKTQDRIIRQILMVNNLEVHDELTKYWEYNRDKGLKIHDYMKDTSALHNRHRKKRFSLTILYYTKDTEG